MQMLELAIVVSVVLIVAITAPLIVVFRRAFATRRDVLVGLDGGFVLELGGSEAGAVFLRLGSSDETEEARALLVRGTLRVGESSQPFEVRGTLSARGDESVRLVEVPGAPARVEGRISCEGGAPFEGGWVYFRPSLEVQER
jgi:hypothetical protein